ncbi:hypothetical protein G7046_g9045 [Stylonectria norvegica]|nr:hypothetical protein G7046_g9045 [Stylonectria norvegica]
MAERRSEPGSKGPPYSLKTTSPGDEDKIESQDVQHVESTEDDENTKISFGLVMHALAIVSGFFANFFANNFQLIGSGVLAHSMVAVVGGADKVVWVQGVIAFHPIILGPVVGRAADFWGRKWFMVGSLIMGVIGCIITSRATNFGQAIAGQVISGFAGINQSLPQAITSEILPRKYRSWAQTIISMPGAAVGLLGLYLTGVMTKNSPEGFRNYWYLLTALYVASALTVAFFYQPPTRELQHLSLQEKIHHLDLPGCFILTIALIGIVMAFTWSDNPYSWQDAHILVPLLVGICAVVVLVVYVVYYRKDGIFHHEYFKSRKFVFCQLILAGEGALFMAANNYVPFQLSIMYGADPIEVSEIFAIGWWTWLVSAPVYGWYIAKTRKARLSLIVALSSFMIYFALMAATDLNSKNRIWGYNVFLGVGFSGGILALTTVVQLSIPPELIAPATGLIIAVRSLGATISLVVYNSILNSVLDSKLVPAISRAATSAGLPASSLQEFIPALLGGSPAALENVPQITDRVIQASSLAMKHVYNIGFRYGYASTAAFSAVAVLSCFLIRDPKEEYNNKIDAPLTERKHEEKL